MMNDPIVVWPPGTFNEAEYIYGCIYSGGHVCEGPWGPGGQWYHGCCLG